MNDVEYYGIVYKVEGLKSGGSSDELEKLEESISSIDIESLSKETVTWNKDPADVGMSAYIRNNIWDMIIMLMSWILACIALGTDDISVFSMFCVSVAVIVISFSFFTDMIYIIMPIFTYDTEFKKLVTKKAIDAARDTEEITLTERAYRWLKVLKKNDTLCDKALKLENELSRLSVVSREYYETLAKIEIEYRRY